MLRRLVAGVGLCLYPARGGVVAQNGYHADGGRALLSGPERIHRIFRHEANQQVLHEELFVGSVQTAIDSLKESEQI